MKVFDCCDQLPFGPHSDVVGWEESVENLESQRGGKLEILHGKADGGGAITNHADVSRYREELGESRTCILKELEERQRIVVQLGNSESDGAPEDKEKTSL
jgi:hypothetical protein